MLFQFFQFFTLQAIGKEARKQSINRSFSILGWDLCGVLLTSRTYMCSSEILQMSECADKNMILPEAPFLRISFLKEKKKKAILKSCTPFSSEIRAHKVLIYDTGHVMPLPLDLLFVCPHNDMQLAHFLILQPSGYSIKIPPKQC